MQIKTLMRTEISPVPVDAELDRADLLLRREALPALPVVKGRALVGVVADTDVRWASPSSWPDLARWETRPTHRPTVADVMRVQVPTLTPESGIGDAARLMAATRLGALPVVERDALLGIVTLRDLLGVLVQESPAREASSTFTTLLVDLAASGHQEAALRTAVDLARRDGGRLVLLHVVPDTHSARPVGAIPEEMSLWFDSRRREDLDAQLRRLVADGPAPRVERETLSGDRLAAALAAARRWEADFIVTGMPVRRGLAGLAHRRRVEALVRQAPCPVLAVGGTEGAPDARG